MNPTVLASGNHPLRDKIEEVHECQNIMPPPPPEKQKKKKERKRRVVKKNPKNIVKRLNITVVT